MYAYVVGGRAEWPQQVRYSRASLFEDLDLEEVEDEASDASSHRMNWLQKQTAMHLVVQAMNILEPHWCFSPRTPSPTLTLLERASTQY